jgi:hypothetical protein
MPELMAEKGGSRTLRGPYDPQTGFEDPSYPSLQSTSLQKSQQSQAPKVRVVVGSWTLFFVAHDKRRTRRVSRITPRTGCQNQPPFLPVQHKYFSTPVRELSVSVKQGDGNERELKCSVRQHEKCSANVCEYCGHGKPNRFPDPSPRSMASGASFVCG